MNSTTNAIAIEWWNGLSPNRKVELCNFHSKSIDTISWEEVGNIHHYETTDTMCSCGLTQSQHQPYCKGEQPPTTVIYTPPVSRQDTEKVLVDEVEQQIYNHLDTLKYEGGYPYGWQKTLANHLTHWLEQRTPVSSAPSVEQIIESLELYFDEYTGKACISKQDLIAALSTAQGEDKNETKHS